MILLARDTGWLPWPDGGSDTLKEKMLAYHRSAEQQIRIPKTAEIVAARIRNAIIRGTLKDGDTLPAEAQLIADFDVSRPTIREAIRILESEKLISVSRGARGGARVNQPTYEMVARAAGIALQANGATLGDVYELRTIIEPAAARMVAERNAKAGAAALRAQLETEKELLKASKDIARQLADFHRILIDLSGNITLMMVGHALHGIVDKHQALAQRHAQARTDLETRLKLARSGLRSQAKLIELIEAGDGAAAQAHWLHHMNAAGIFWLQDLAPTAVVDLLD